MSFHLLLNVTSHVLSVCWSEASSVLFSAKLHWLHVHVSACQCLRSPASSGPSFPQLLLEIAMSNWLYWQKAHRHFREHTCTEWILTFAEIILDLTPTAAFHWKPLWWVRAAAWLNSPSSREHCKITTQVGSEQWNKTLWPCFKTNCVGPISLCKEKEK